MEQSLAIAVLAGLVEGGGLTADSANPLCKLGQFLHVCRVGSLLVKSI